MDRSLTGLVLAVAAAAGLLVRVLHLLGLAHQAPDELLHVRDFVVLGDVDAAPGAHEKGERALDEAHWRLSAQDIKKML